MNKKKKYRQMLDFIVFLSKTSCNDHKHICAACEAQGLLRNLFSEDAPVETGE